MSERIAGKINECNMQTVVLAKHIAIKAINRLIAKEYYFECHFTKGNVNLSFSRSIDVIKDLGIRELLS